MTIDRFENAPHLIAKFANKEHGEDLFLAYTYAEASHAAAGQKRKFGKQEDYIVHPVRVAEIVAQTPNNTSEMIQAAFLHDVVEDTAVTFSQLSMLFNQTVVDLVFGLTQLSKQINSKENRAARKKMDNQFLKSMPEAVQTVKAADIKANLESLSDEGTPESFIKLFVEEKFETLEILEKSDIGLYYDCYDMIRALQSTNAVS